jgi:hypothetical protein
MMEESNSITDSILINQQTDDNYSIGYYALKVTYVLGIVTYMVYTIKSLCETSYSEQKNLCSESNAWIYLLISVVINPIIGLIQLFCVKFRGEHNMFVMSAISSLAFLIWWCIEFYNVNCVNELEHTLLYTMLIVTVLSNLVITCLSFLFFIFRC